MADQLATTDQLDALAGRIDAWLAIQLAENPAVAAVDAQSAPRRWFVRMRGEEKDTFTVWLTLDQRTLGYDTYVMPAPEENHAAFYEHLLRRNRGFDAMSFSIGEEDAIFLGGRMPVGAVDDGELDRILGETYVYVERCFRPAMRIGFASRFRG